MKPGRFDRLFNARAIAVVGATEDASRAGGQAVHALRTNGYQGSVYPVNPKYTELHGYRCYPSLEAIGEPLDVVVIALPAKAVLDVIPRCGPLAIPYAVVLGAGFRESGPEGHALQDRMVELARAAGVRVIGPNCLGMANVHQRVFAAFGSLTREPLLEPGPVSMVMQSGGFGNSLAFRCHAAGIGFRLLVASGNEADLTAPELIDAMIEDEETKVILSYMEGVNDGRALMDVGRRALAAGKPLLVWKAGNTRQGSKVAATHTANLTGSYDVWQAAFRQCGILEVRDTEHAADAIRALLAGRLPRGRRIAMMGPSGGSAVAFTDTADEVGLELPPPEGECKALLERRLVGVASLMNPVDLAASFLSPTNAENFNAAVAAMVAAPGYDQFCMNMATTITRTARIVATGIAAHAGTDKPVLAFSSVPHEAAPEAFDILAKAGIPVFTSPPRMARAAAVLADYARFRDELPRQPAWAAPAAPPPAVLAPHAGRGGMLDEAESKSVIAAFGVPVTRDRIVGVAQADGVAALDLPYPVAVKVLCADIPHKTDAGGVMLGVPDAKALAAAIRRVADNARKAVPTATVDRVLVSGMVGGAVEMIAGVVNDAVFGPVVVLGMGGVLAEAIRDVAYRVAPFGLETAREMIDELRGRRVLDGMRGRPACDVEALAGALANVSRLAWECRGRIAELDINPLMVRPAGEGVVAVDALVVLK